LSKVFRAREPGGEMTPQEQAREWAYENRNANKHELENAVLPLFEQIATMKRETAPGLRSLLASANERIAALEAGNARLAQDIEEGIPMQALITAKERIAELERAPSGGVMRIAAERQRQIEAEGWTEDHDEQHGPGVLTEAGACYANQAAQQLVDPQLGMSPVPAEWPWAGNSWKPSSSPIRNLEKAGALIAAEIDRAIRRTALPPPPVGPAREQGHPAAGSDTQDGCSVRDSEPSGSDRSGGGGLCARCDGSGIVTARYVGKNRPILAKCADCDGSGTNENEQESPRPGGPAAESAGSGAGVGSPCDDRTAGPAASGAGGSTAQLSLVAAILCTAPWSTTGTNSMGQRAYPTSSEAIKRARRLIALAREEQ
jgi:hypothetical protein